jgi:hypothetical protein
VTSATRTCGVFELRKKFITAAHTLVVACLVQDSTSNLFYHYRVNK